jgi:hypothetical protein
MAHLGVLGVGAEHVVTSRFLARMVVATALPRAAAGGLRAVPRPSATAGEWGRGCRCSSGASVGAESGRFLCPGPPRAWHAAGRE